MLRYDNLKVTDKQSQYFSCMSSWNYVPWECERSWLWRNRFQIVAQNYRNFETQVDFCPMLMKHQKWTGNASGNAVEDSQCTKSIGKYTCIEMGPFSNVLHVQCDRKPLTTSHLNYETCDQVVFNVYLANRRKRKIYIDIFGLDCHCSYLWTID